MMGAIFLLSWVGVPLPIYPLCQPMMCLFIYFGWCPQLEILFYSVCTADLLQRAILDTVVIQQ